MTTAATRPSWKQRLEQYGKLGFVVYFSIFFLTIGLFAAMLKLGFAERIPWLASHAGDGATLVAAYALTKLVQVPRIALTLAITPVIARRMGKA
ncbi:MAG: FAM210A/B-like domain-containing protein [Myxococcota bacterium]